jgi:hypothetical protein
MTDPMLYGQLEIIIIILGVLLAIGVVAWAVKMVMKPAVFIVIFAALGWLLYYSTM